MGGDFCLVFFAGFDGEGDVVAVCGVDAVLEDFADPGASPVGVVVLGFGEELWADSYVAHSWVLGVLLLVASGTP